MERILSDLKELRLPGMAQTWLNLMEGHSIPSLSLADGIRLLIQGEKDMRISNRTRRLIKNARFRYTVTMGDIAADSARGVEQSRLDEMTSCNYIEHGYPVGITGATGTGKSWLASALGYCKDFPITPSDRIADCTRSGIRILHSFLHLEIFISLLLIRFVPSLTLTCSYYALG